MKIFQRKRIVKKAVLFLMVAQKAHKTGVLRQIANFFPLLTNYRDSDIFVNRCNKFVINH